MQAIEKLIKYDLIAMDSPSVGAMSATLFFAGQRFYAQMLLPKTTAVDVQAQVRRSLEAMVLVGLASWVGDEMDDDTLESGHHAEQEDTKPLGRPLKRDRVQRPLESEPISAPLPLGEPMGQHEMKA